MIPPEGRLSYRLNRENERQMCLGKKDYQTSVRLGVCS